MTDEDEVRARARGERPAPEDPNVPLDLRDAHGGPAPIGDATQVGHLDAELDHDPKVDAPERVERPHHAVARDEVRPPNRQPYEPVGDLTQPSSGVTGDPPSTGPIAPTAQEVGTETGGGWRSD